MKSEIPATSAWLWVRWCAWGPATLSCCSFLLFHAMCGKRGHRSCVQPSVCYPERRVGPWAGIRLQEVNRQLERSGPDSGFRNVEAKMKTALELFLPVSVAVRVYVLSLLSSESLSTELENRIKKGFFFCLWLDSMYHPTAFKAGASRASMAEIPLRWPNLLLCSKPEFTSDQVICVYCSDARAQVSTVVWATSTDFLGFYIRWEIYKLDLLCGPCRVFNLALPKLSWISVWKSGNMFW